MTSRITHLAFYTLTLARTPHHAPRILHLPTVITVDNRGPSAVAWLVGGRRRQGCDCDCRVQTTSDYKVLVISYREA